MRLRRDKSEDEEEEINAEGAEIGRGRGEMRDKTQRLRSFAALRMTFANCAFRQDAVNEEGFLASLGMTCREILRTWGAAMRRPYKGEGTNHL